MRHSFKAAPPADVSPKKPSVLPTQSESQEEGYTAVEGKRRKPRRKTEHLNGHAAPEKLPAANGMNGHSRAHQLGENSWKAVTEEALRKLQSSMSTDVRPTSASPAVSSASVTGLSRSASFASLDSQPQLEGSGHKGSDAAAPS